MRKINLFGLPLGLFLVAALLVAALTAPAVLADTTPILCWGNIDLDGSPAPVGTTVEIFVGADTTASGSAMVTVAGKYGSIQLWADDSRYGESLTYKVNGFTATKLGPDAGVFGLANQVVNLEAFSGSPPPTVTPTPVASPMPTVTPTSTASPPPTVTLTPAASPTPTATPLPDGGGGLMNVAVVGIMVGALSVGVLSLWRAKRQKKGSGNDSPTP